MAQHFLLSAKARTLSVVAVARMSDDEARATFRALRWENGEPASFEEIDRRHGEQLRANLGIRYIGELTSATGGVVTDTAAPLPHDFASGGIRKLAGITYRDIRDSVLKDMYGLFDDDPRLGPSLQAQLFAYSGLGALAALPVSLSELVANPYEFRVAGGTAFQGLDALSELRPAGSEELARQLDMNPGNKTSSLEALGRLDIDGHKGAGGQAREKFDPGPIDGLDLSDLPPLPDDLPPLPSGDAPAPPARDPQAPPDLKPDRGDLPLPPLPEQSLGLDL